ncbi:MAG: Flp pilus assembly complex ATPase component TadA [Phycisphaerae bacterium]|mgnify:CR=1 FL=1|nr:Flp pilus assembly complex ATPase component TadA [Phycisphaerae bacterium]
MQLIAYSQFTDARQIVSLDGLAEASIGRDDDNTLALPSPFVSRHHAKVVIDNGSYYVENLGLNGTIVRGENVPVGSRVPLSPGEEFKVGEFSVYLLDQGEQKAATTLSVRRRDPLAEVLELECRIHQELLHRLNLRTIEASAKDDPRYVAHIREHLRNILDDEIDDIEDATGWAIVEDFVKRRITDEISFGHTARPRQDSVFSDATEIADHRSEEAVGRIVRVLRNAIGVSGDRSRLKQDLRLVDDKFPGQFDRIADQITGGLWEHVVRSYITKEILDTVLGLGPLQDLLDMPNLTEVMVVGRDRIYVDEAGVIRNTGRKFLSDEVVMTVIERIVTPIGRRIDQSTPIVDARLPDGSRVNATIPPLSLSGPLLTIRRFAEKPYTIDDLVEFGSLTPWTARFLQSCVAGRKNVLVSGGTASGKTTLLNVLSNFISPDERIITIEDSAELQLSQEHVVRMETRPANVEGKGAYTIRHLVQNSLRMRPDRVVVGECRGPEALDMLQAMNTGHDGSLTTIHANGPEDAMKRLETLVLEAVEMPVRAIREQIVTALDMVVHLSRFADGARKVTHISEVVAIDQDVGNIIVEDIFTLNKTGRDSRHGLLVHTGYIPTFARDLIAKGLLTADSFA